MCSQYDQATLSVGLAAGQSLTLCRGYTKFGLSLFQFTPGPDKTAIANAVVKVLCNKTFLSSRLSPLLSVWLLWRNSLDKARKEFLK